MKFIIFIIMIISLYAGDPNEFDIEEPMVEYIIKHIHKYDIDADYYFERSKFYSIKIKLKMNTLTSCLKYSMMHY